MISQKQDTLPELLLFCERPRLVAKQKVQPHQGPLAHAENYKQSTFLQKMFFVKEALILVRFEIEQ